MILILSWRTTDWFTGIINTISIGIWTQSNYWLIPCFVSGVYTQWMKKNCWYLKCRLWYIGWISVHSYDRLLILLLLISHLYFLLKQCFDKNLLKKNLDREFPGGPVAKPLCSQCRGPPGQATRTHMPQVRVCTPKLKIPHATTTTTNNPGKLVLFMEFISTSDWVDL